MARNPKTGTIFAFAEARRRGLHEYHHGYQLDGSGGCPDAPDTHVAYKRSTNGGATWSSLQILFKEPAVYQSQASPVFDSTTGKLIVLFTQGWYPKNVAMQIESVDDGLHWSNPKPMVPAPGVKPIVLSTNGARGHVVALESGIRLLFPSQAGSLYSDDHGATWTVGKPPVGFGGGVGEAAIARCTFGAACNGKSWVVVNRCVLKPNLAKCIAFSGDGVAWDPAVPMNITQFANASYAPGAVGVPGALIVSHNGGFGLWQQGPSGLRIQGKGDPAGEDLLYTVDGKEWKLLHRLWPFRGGYSVLAELDTDADGAALTYGTLFEAGGVLDGDTYILFMNFTWTDPAHAPQREPVVV